MKLVFSSGNSKRGDRARRLCGSLILLLCCAPALHAATVEGVRLWRAPDHTRLVFDLDDTVDHRIFPLQNPDRLVIDINGARLQNPIAGLALEETPIQSLRTAARNKTDLRIVLDLATAVNPRSFILERNEQYGDRLVVDLFDKQAKTEKSELDVVQSEGLDRPIIIAIDAGHGGEDPGAIGPGRIQEKQVVLAIGRELQRLVDREPGFKAYMVRSGDYYIPLRTRTELARKQRADLFVSIHADAFSKSTANGASVFALSPRGATSETARYLAQRENRADLIGGVGSVSLSDKDQMLAGVLLDLSMTATLSSSLEVGDRVLGAVGGVARLHKDQVEQAGFVVLKSPDIPSILVETGFISNPTEARRLSSGSYQRRMAEAIFAGVRQFFVQKPPVGTWLATRRNQGGEKVYVIARGDTLSEIASRHNLSVEALLRHNGMKSTVIRIGQRIKIPAS